MHMSTQTKNAVRVGLWARMEAKPGKEEEVADFLTGARAAVDREPDTVAWFAVRLGKSTFGIFDVFPGEGGRQAHLKGRVAEALMAEGPELFAGPLQIEPLDTLAYKLP